jgi:ubiquinone/menaquinone biosynthesis C-methylase UbiE
MEENRPPVCDYEGSDYQSRFWEKGDREYEDLCEAIALKHLMPRGGKLLLELGAGAGRNTSRYTGFERVVLLDYSRTQLLQAQQKLGQNRQYIYVAADIYRLPFVDGLFDAATMIRTLHHMVDARAALKNVREVLQPGASFILEYANKRNLKAILRYALKRQTWNPFTPEQVEFTPLNFDFHPRTIRSWLVDLGFSIEKIRSVSHFRVGFLKRGLPPALLAWMDGLLQWTGSFLQYSPSIFVRAKLPGEAVLKTGEDILSFFKCPKCGGTGLKESIQHLACPSCGVQWSIEDGIYIFKD